MEISLKDAERGPLNHLEGYILRNLYRKHLSKASKETNIFAKKKRNLWLYSTSFMLMSPLPRIQHLLLPKIGEVGGTPRNT